MKKRMLSMLIVLAMMITLLPVSVKAAGTHTLTVTGGTEGTDYEWGGFIYGVDDTQDNVLAILTATPLTITGDTTNAEGFKDVISIDSEVKANLTLNGVIIKSSHQSAGITIAPGGELDLTLQGENKFMQTIPQFGNNKYNYPAIRIPEDASLTITKESVGSLTSLTYGGAAVIGGHRGEDCGTITIEGGKLKVEAIGEDMEGLTGGPAIGPGRGATKGNISINGGYINAISKYGAAIGTSETTTNEEKVIITGGTVIATGGISYAIGNKGTDGIGDGTNTTDKGSVTITGGNVSTLVRHIRPQSSANEDLYKTALILSGAGEGTGVSNISVLTASIEPYSYGAKDMVTDASEKIYIWLPKGAKVTSVTAGGETYVGDCVVTTDETASTFKNKKLIREASVLSGGVATEYATLEEAIAAAETMNGSIVKLLTDVTTEKTVEVNKGTFTIDLNGKTWTSNVPGYNAALLLQGLSNVTLKGTNGGTFTISGGGQTIFAMWAPVTIEGGTYECTGTGDVLYLVSGGKKVIINGGVFKGVTRINDCTDVTISGGTFQGRTNFVTCKDVAISGGTFAELTTFVHEGFISTVGGLLAGGYAYRNKGDSTWVSDVAITKLEGVTVQSIPIKITTQPKDHDLTYGYTEFPVLSVTAETIPADSGKAITYQWYKDSAPIVGATGVSYTIPTGLAAGNSTYYCAVTSDAYTKNSDTSTITVNAKKIAIIFKSAYGQETSQDFISGDPIVLPKGPTRYGYTFTGWSITEDDIAAAIEGQTPGIIAEANYTLNDESYQITVTNGAGGGSHQLNDVVTATAAAITLTPEGEKEFSHWSEGMAPSTDNILSYSTIYKFYATKDLKIIANYVAKGEAVQKQGTTYITNMEKDTENSKLIFVSMATVPAGCTILKAGVIATDNGEVGRSGASFKKGAADVLERGNPWTGNAYRFTWTKNIAEADINKTWYVRSYLLYKEGGVEKTVYGNMVFQNYSGRQ